MTTEKIKCGYGPEDISLEQNTNFYRLIISCTKRKRFKQLDGGIWYYNLKKRNQEAQLFELVGYNQEIRPHGIDIINELEKSFIYLICHYKGNKILKFELSATTLIFVEKWEDSEYPFSEGINDLSISSQGHLYITDPGKASLNKKKGKIHYIKNRVLTSYSDGLHYPNGILIKNKKLYVTAFRDNKLLSYDLNEEGFLTLSSKKILASIKGGDNITLTGKNLIIAGHPSIFKFIIHALFNKIKAPSSVFKYNLETQKLEELFMDNGKNISASSTGLLIKEKLYISQVFNNYLLKVTFNN